MKYPLIKSEQQSGLIISLEITDHTYLHLAKTRLIIYIYGDLWDAHPGHKAPVPPHPKYALLG